MKLLRRMIRQIILEGPVKDSFDELWYNTEEERQNYDMMQSGEGTFHRDLLADKSKSYLRPYTDEFIEQFFEDKRDLKRLWNNVVDENGLRSFWEGPKMQYFHSLAYYGSPAKGEDYLGTGQTEDEALSDLTAWGFFQLYDKTGNKDEMSTYGIYNGENQIPKFQTNFGVMISGRVTLATMNDAWTESRSKGTKKDLANHASSGMPKRIMPTDEMIQTLLFEEEDIKEFGKIGECIIDNWSIDAIVCNPNMKDELVEAADALAKQYGVPMITIDGVDVT